VNGGGLHLVPADRPARSGAPPDPQSYQAGCIEAYQASQVARGFSQLTIDNGTGTLERFLAACGHPAWEVTLEDIDRVVGQFAAAGMATNTRRGYVSVFKGFFAFLLARKATEIAAFYGVTLADPIDEFNAARHVGSDSPATAPPPTPARLGEFFAFLRERIATGRVFAIAGRDYALYRTLYHAGLRAEEAVTLDVADVHFDRGPFGKLHVRFGKATHGSGPRPRWVPMLDHLDLILRWYLDDVRPHLPAGSVLFPDQCGGQLHRGSVRNRLTHLLDLEGRPVAERFSPHALRRACATHNYERGVDLIAIQQLLGHWAVGTTMKYVSPSSTFIEDAYRRAISDTLSQLDVNLDGKE
jgi:site-specific recombinase XerD